MYLFLKNIDYKISSQGQGLAYNMVSPVLHFQRKEERERENPLEQIEKQDGRLIKQEPSTCLLKAVAE